MRRAPAAAVAAAALLAAALLAATGAMAGERTVTLSVDNMTCPTCPLIVRRSLEKVGGVLDVAVSYEDKTAVVTFDDERADVGALTEATTRAGYPSRPVPGAGEESGPAGRLQ